jgi:hypothetical protein
MFRLKSATALENGVVASSYSEVSRNFSSQLIIAHQGSIAEYFCMPE